MNAIVVGKQEKVAGSLVWKAAPTTVTYTSYSARAETSDTNAQYFKFENAGRVFISHLAFYTRDNYFANGNMSGIGRLDVQSYQEATRNYVTFQDYNYRDGDINNITNIELGYFE